MAEARVARPKGISRDDWDNWIDKLGTYRALDSTDPDNEVIIHEQSKEIADQTAALFLAP